MDNEFEPSGYLKKVLADGERIRFATRQHPLFFLRHIGWSLTFLVTIFLGVIWSQLALAPNNPAVSLGLLLLVIPIGLIWWSYLVWKNHAYIVTDNRVIQIRGVFNKDVVDSLLEKVNDVKTDQSLIGQWFNYGDLEVLTANDSSPNLFQHIAQPLELKRAMMDAKERRDAAHASGSAPVHTPMPAAPEPA